MRPAREALKYETVEKIDIVEIDPRVVEACRTLLTGKSAGNLHLRIRSIRDI